MAEIVMSETDIEQIASVIAGKVLTIIHEKFRENASSEATTKRIVNRLQLAEILGVSASTIDRRVRAGTIPSIGGGSSRRFVVADVLKALQDLPSQEGQS